MEVSYLPALIGWSGIVAFVITMAEIPFWFLYSGAPPLKNIVFRTFISLFILPAMLVFSVGLVLFEPSPFTVIGVILMTVFASVTYVSHSMQLGAALKSKQPVDPTLVGSGAEGSLLIYGPISHLLFSLTLVSFATGLLISQTIPTWLAVLGYVIAAFQLILVPTILSKTIPARFYSLNGWNIPISGGLFTVWMLVTSIYFLVK